MEKGFNIKQALRDAGYKVYWQGDILFLKNYVAERESLLNGKYRTTVKASVKVFDDATQVDISENWEYGDKNQNVGSVYFKRKNSETALKKLTEELESRGFSL